MSAANRDVVVFLAHRFDQEIERRFLKLKQECSATSDIVLFAESGTAVPENLRPFAHYFDFSTVRRTAKSVVGDSVVPGNAHLRALDYFRRFSQYRYYWFIEYDVVYTGDWGAFITSFAEDTSDLIAAHVRAIADESDWHWRESLSAGAEPLPDDRFMIAFLPWRVRCELSGWVTLKPSYPRRLPMPTCASLISGEAVRGPRKTASIGTT